MTGDLLVLGFVWLHGLGVGLIVAVALALRCGEAIENWERGDR